MMQKEAEPPELGSPQPTSPSPTPPSSPKSSKDQAPPRASDTSGTQISLRPVSEERSWRGSGPKPWLSWRRSQRRSTKKGAFSAGAAAQPQPRPSPRENLALESTCVIVCDVDAVDVIATFLMLLSRGYIIALYSRAAPGAGGGGARARGEARRAERRIVRRRRFAEPHRTRPLREVRLHVEVDAERVFEKGFGRELAQVDARPRARARLQVSALGDVHLRDAVRRARLPLCRTHQPRKRINGHPRVHLTDPRRLRVDELFEEESNRRRDEVKQGASNQHPLLLWRSPDADSIGETDQPRISRAFDSAAALTAKSLGKLHVEEPDACQVQQRVCVRPLTLFVVNDGRAEGERALARFLSVPARDRGRSLLPVRMVRMRKHAHRGPGAPGVHKKMLCRGRALRFHAAHSFRAPNRSPSGRSRRLDTAPSAS
mmetsp:Transcript_26813/g.87982  ORF Transcript_26813/g.87982 Transcript_26813/m.87982 type:complete len:430 (-) Transcript_26813:1317-2606(-)